MWEEMGEEFSWTVREQVYEGKNIWRVKVALFVFTKAKHKC